MLLKCLTGFFSILCFVVISSKCTDVSSKLDFDDSSERSTMDKTVVGQMAAKIQGVRVIVTKMNPEIKIDEDDSIVLSSANNNRGGNIISVNGLGSKKTVGIRTDITFEITQEDANNTAVEAKNIDDDDADAEVPIFKGTKGVDSDPSNRVTPSSPINVLHVHIGQPVFHQTNDEEYNRGGGGGGGTAGIDTWNNFIPVAGGVWTTERNFILKRKETSGFKGIYPPTSSINKPWKQPCVCHDQTQWRGFHSSPPLLHRTRIDDKLDDPFSSV